MNILICSVGRRVQLINYFKEELRKTGGKVIAIGCDPSFPALYHADYFEIVPRIDHPDYIPCIKNLCRKYKVKGILTLIDSELLLLSRFKEEFRKEGIHIIVPDQNIVDICNDKYLTYQFLSECHLPTVKTFIDINLVIQELEEGNIEFPLIVKPRSGNGSIGVQKLTNLQELQIFWEENSGFIIQPFIRGEEYCVECYIDLLTAKPTNLFSKRKINMRGGETDKSIAIKDPDLDQITFKLLHELNPVGPIDIDFFKINDGYFISEINPRFGGGYPYAHELGQNFIQSIINNLRGIPNSSYVPYDGKYEEGKTMIRYDHYIVL